MLPGRRRTTKDARRLGRQPVSSKSDTEEKVAQTTLCGTDHFAAEDLTDPLTIGPPSQYTTSKQVGGFYDSADAAGDSW